MRKQGFKDIKCLVKIRDINKIKKKKLYQLLYKKLYFGFENKFPIYVSKNTFKKHVDLLLIEEEGKSQYVLIKDFNTFMYNQTLHHDRKHFGCYYL